MNLKVGETNYELKPQGEISVRLSDGGKLQVANWFVGTSKPLTATLANGAWRFES